MQHHILAACGHGRICWHQHAVAHIMVVPMHHTVGSVWLLSMLVPFMHAKLRMEDVMFSCWAL